VLPVGNGTLLLGAANGFAALHEAGLIPAPPRLIAVQAAACAPVAAAWQAGAATVEAVAPGPTRAEGIAIPGPVRGRQILAAVAGTGGQVLAVDEEEIAEARQALAGRGLYVEPTAAATYAGVRAHLGEPADPVERLVVFPLCGAGSKAEA
jgi:threonine synthase